MDDDVKQRSKWVKLYEETHEAGLVCARCGISRPTLRKWLRRYTAEGEAGLHAYIGIMVLVRDFWYELAQSALSISPYIFALSIV